MSFLDIEDYKAVVDGKTLDVINQSDPENLKRAEGYAIEEMKGYLRAAEPSKTGIAPYGVNAAFSQTGADRNSQLVMYACDIALYHLIAWLPQRIGFEIRDIRYKRAIEWLESVQAGEVILDIPLIENESDEDIPIRWGSWDKIKNDY